MATKGAYRFTGGVWVPTSSDWLFTRVAGVWQRSKVYERIAGVWTEITSTAAPTTTTLMGINVDNTSGIPNSTWDAIRCYSFTKATSTVTSGTKILAVSDDQGVSAEGGATSANALNTFLLGFYGKTGTPSRNANCQIHWANGNEIDANTVNFTSFANTYELMESVIANYPMASLWLDGTINHMRTGATENYLSAQATSGRRVYQMLDGFAGSYYPSGRNNYPNISATSFTTANSLPQNIVDLFVSKAIEKGITRMAIWEYGMPLACTPPPQYPNPGSTYRDNNRRRDFVQTFINYWMQACIDNGLVPEVAIYWDHQSPQSGVADGDPGNNNPDNRFITDPVSVSPNTATMWYNAAANFVPA